MSEIKWSGVSEADAIATYNALFKDADPNAKYYQTSDGIWVIEASAMKTNIPAVTIDGEDGKPVLLSPDEHATWIKDGGKIKVK